MEKYKELKEKCDDCLKEMGEPEKIFREVVEKLEQAFQLGELSVPESVEFALAKMRLREKAHYCMAEYCKNYLEDVCRWKEMIAKASIGIKKLTHIFGVWKWD